MRALRRVPWAIPAFAFVAWSVLGPTGAPASASTTRHRSASAPVAGSGGLAGEKRIALPPVSPAHPLRVTVFGDSVPYVAEPAIAASLDATGEVTVTDSAFPGFGLSNDPTWATPKHGIASLIASTHAELVLATWSWDNVCTASERSKGDICALTDPAAFKQQVEKLVRLMLGPGGASGVVFIQFPPTGPDVAAGEQADNPQLAQKTDGNEAFDRIVRSLPAAFPGKVLYLPVASSVLLHGRFTFWLPPTSDPGAPTADWVRVRMTDGVHMCPAGAARYAAAILADLTSLYHLAPAHGTWQSGPWVSTARFTTAPGACPADHPPG